MAARSDEEYAKRFEEDKEWYNEYCKVNGREEQVCYESKQNKDENKQRWFWPM